MCKGRKEKHATSRVYFLVMGNKGDKHSGCTFHRADSECVFRGDAPAVPRERRKSIELTPSRYVALSRSSLAPWQDREKRRGNARGGGGGRPTLSRVLQLPIPSGPLGIGPGNGCAAFCIGNNSVPGLFGNVAANGDPNSRGMARRARGID